jgi:hypothetical protein
MRAPQHLFEFLFSPIGERAIGVAALRRALLGDPVAKQVELQIIRPRSLASRL